MKTPAWRRLVARALLLTFTTWVVACGGSKSEAPATTTTTAIPTTSTALETTTTAEPPPTTAPAPPATLPAQPPQQLGKQELRDLVAPVALYPDVVLSSLLPATTNPEQVHEAAAFVGQAQRVERIPDDRGWDGSVLGLLQFPDVLRWLDANPAWTEEMGQAVTYQQGDVLEAIQDYRRAVRDVGNLKSNQYQTVRAAPNQGIRIEPARPDVVYVPSYDPAVATQPQPAQESSGINPWLAFGGGAVVGALGAWALYSIFDDDDDHGDGGRHQIRRYDDYYYARGRRPQPVEWTPRQRTYRTRPEGWQRPRRLEHVAQPGRPARAAAPLRAPTTHEGGQAPRPAETKRERRQERRVQRQENKQEQRLQRQEQQREQREQRQDRRKEQQQQRQQRQEQQREQRQERQQQRERQQQQRQEQREQRQKERQQNRVEQNKGKAEKPKAKKKQQQQQQQQQQQRQ